MYLRAQSPRARLRGQLLYLADGCSQQQQDAEGYSRDISSSGNRVVTLVFKHRMTGLYTHPHKILQKEIRTTLRTLLPPTQSVQAE